MAKKAKKKKATEKSKENEVQSIKKVEDTTVENVTTENEEIAQMEEKAEKSEIVAKDENVAIEEIKQVMKKKKVIPQEETKKINKKIFKNIMVAIGVILYFVFLNLGYMNIKLDVYITDLRVFGMCVLLIAIALIENAYKKDDGEIALYGVEMIILSVITIALIYVSLMLADKFVYIVGAISCILAMYYVIKSIIIYIRMKRQYFVDDMKKVINKEEDEG